MQKCSSPTPFKNLKIRCVTGIIFALLLVGIFFLLPPIFFSLFILIAGIAMVVEWSRLCIATPLLWLLMPVYPVALTLLIILLNQQPSFRPLLMYLFGIVWAFDSGGYLAGSLIGRTKIAPRISPNKSWEGFLGGFLCALATMYLIRMFAPHSNATPIALLCIVLATCVAAFAGDLFESAIKRLAGVKDSGSLLPGHGGVLDRLDAILFATVLFYFLRHELAILLL